MRITIRVTSAGECWKPDVPAIDCDRILPDGKDGRRTFDRSEFARQFRDCREVQTSSDERADVIAFGCDLLRSLNEWHDESVAPSEREERSVAPRLKGRDRRGMFGYVRIDLYAATKDGTPCVRARVRHDEGNVVNGANGGHVKECAFLVAEFLRVYRDLFAERGDPPLLFSEETQGLVDENHERTMAAKLEELKSAMLSRKSA